MNIFYHRQIKSRRHIYLREIHFHNKINRTNLKRKEKHFKQIYSQNELRFYYETIMIVNGKVNIVFIVMLIIEIKSKQTLDCP